MNSVLCRRHAAAVASSRASSRTTRRFVHATAALALALLTGSACAPRVARHAPQDDSHELVLWTSVLSILVLHLAALRLRPARPGSRLARRRQLGSPGVCRYLPAAVHWRRKRAASFELFIRFDAFSTHVTVRCCAPPQDTDNCCNCQSKEQIWSGIEYYAKACQQCISRNDALHPDAYLGGSLEQGERPLQDPIESKVRLFSVLGNSFWPRLHVQTQQLPPPGHKTGSP